MPGTEQIVLIKSTLSRVKALKFTKHFTDFMTCLPVAMFCLSKKCLVMIDWGVWGI